MTIQPRLGRSESSHSPEYVWCPGHCRWKEDTQSSPHAAVKGQQRGQQPPLNLHNSLKISQVLESITFREIFPRSFFPLTSTGREDTFDLSYFEQQFFFLLSDSVILTQTCQPKDSCLHSITLLKDPEGIWGPRWDGKWFFGFKVCFPHYHSEQWLV